MKLVTALTACLLVSPSVAQDIRVIGGDRFEFDGEVIRLWGIDAPELDQTCEGLGSTHKAGEIASEMLERLLATAPSLECKTVDIDQYGHTIARCLIGADDLAGLMVEAGHAWDWPRFSNGFYRDPQRYAQATLSGVWAMDCEPPWEWRERN